eukprot:scaffold422993_cov14-Prasinocladus_malaysianus.AAC.1
MSPLPATCYASTSLNKFRASIATHSNNYEEHAEYIEKGMAVQSERAILVASSLKSTGTREPTGTDRVPACCCDLLNGNPGYWYPA